MPFLIKENNFFAIFLSSPLFVAFKPYDLMPISKNLALDH
jgi:hypothetical protein